MKKKLFIILGLFICFIYYAIGVEGLHVGSSSKNTKTRFVEEIYLRDKSGKIPKDTFRISQVKRNVKGQWYISVVNSVGIVVSVFLTTHNDEFPIVYLSPGNNSGIYGYAKVNWNAINDSAIVDNPETFPIGPDCFNPKNSPEINKFINSRVLYVSSSDGEIGNLGMSPDSPVPSITSVFQLRRDKEIKLKSGDVFYENIDCLDANVSLGSYGEGPKPILSGWKIVKKKKDVWQEGRLEKGRWISEKGTHIWRIDLEKNDCFEGRLCGSSKYFNNIGLVVDRKTWKTYGRKVEFMYKSESNDPISSEQHNNYLERQFDFYQTSKYKNLSSEDFRYLYLYSEKNPSSFELMFSTYGTGIVMNNSSIENIQIEGFGCHGVGAGSNVKISNCDIRYIGGSQHVSNSLWIRYGNGVEFYLSKNEKNGYVANNRIAKVFDCGMTIQGNSTKPLVASNIVMENNIIDSCRQSFEFFLNDGDPKNTKDCINCYFRTNLCMNAGENGFDSPETRDLHVLSYQRSHKSTMIIEKNLFFGGNGFYSAMQPDMLSFGHDNVFYFVDNPILWNQGFRGHNKIKYDKEKKYEYNIRKNCPVLENVKIVHCTLGEYQEYLREKKELLKNRNGKTEFH